MRAICCSCPPRWSSIWAASQNSCRVFGNRASIPPCPPAASIPCGIRNTRPESSPLDGILGRFALLGHVRERFLHRRLQVLREHPKPRHSVFGECGTEGGYSILDQFPGLGPI